MRHRKKGRKLSRKKAHREHLMRNLATSLILYEKINTTEAKAKELKGMVEKLINKGRKNDITTRRYLQKYLFDKNAVKKILEDLSLQFQERKSGMIKIIKRGKRQGDSASMVIVELLVKHKKEEEDKAKKQIDKIVKKKKKDRVERRGFWDRFRRDSKEQVRPERIEKGKKTVERTTSK